MSWHLASTGGLFVKKRRGLELKAKKLQAFACSVISVYSMTPRFRLHRSGGTRTDIHTYILSGSYICLDLYGESEETNDMRRDQILTQALVHHDQAVSYCLKKENINNNGYSTVLYRTKQGMAKTLATSTCNISPSLGSLFRPLVNRFLELNLLRYLCYS